MYDKLKKESPALVNRGRALFQQVNARAHTVRLTKEFKQMDGVESLPHPPFSPEAAPGDYGLFCSMAHFLRDQRFNTFDEVKEACLQFFFFFFFSFFFSFFFLFFFPLFFSLFFFSLFLKLKASGLDSGRDSDTG